MASLLGIQTQTVLLGLGVRLQMMVMMTKNQKYCLTTVNLLVSLEEVLLDETHAALTALIGSLT